MASDDQAGSNDVLPYLGGTAQSASRPANQSRDWNNLEVSVTGNQIVTRLHAVQIVDSQDPVMDGVVGLQVYTGGGVNICFKDIYVRDLEK